MPKARSRMIAISAILLIALVSIIFRKSVSVRPEPELPPAVSKESHPSAVPHSALKARVPPVATPAHDPADEGPAPMVILEEIVINQEHRKLGSSPDIDSALARLPVLEKCAQAQLEIVRLPSLDSHIRMHVGILRRFKKPKEARQWLEGVRGCSPHARMEIIKAYFLE